MSSTLAPAGFSPETFAPFMAGRDEPGWLSDLRTAAWSRFNELGLPTQRDEEWMRTDIRLFKLDRFSPATEIPEACAGPATGRFRVVPSFVWKVEKSVPAVAMRFRRSSR